MKNHLTKNQKIRLIEETLRAWKTRVLSSDAALLAISLAIFPPPPLKPKHNKINKALNHILIGDIIEDSNKIFKLEKNGKNEWMLLLNEKTKENICKNHN